MPPTVIPSTPALPLLAVAMLPSDFLAHRLPPPAESCWPGFRDHASPDTIRSLPSPLSGLHPWAQKRSPVRAGYSAACRFRDACSTRLSSRSGLQSPFPVRPIRWLRLSAPECLTSLADITTYYAFC